MSTPSKPDMAKVYAALAAIEARRNARKGKTTVHYPLQPSPPAHDAAIRKDLKSHGDPCVGFNYYHFLNRQ